jgi:hypothetical protein
VIAEYKTAVVVPGETDNERRIRVWNQSLPLVGATVSGRAPGFVTVQFPDAPEPVRVYPPADYEGTQDIRVKGSTLYVYRVILLLWADHRIAVYDLANRKLLVDLLVAPEDLSP